MTADNIVQDAQLLSVLAAADRAREQCLAILDLMHAHQDGADAPAMEELATQRKALFSHLGKVRGFNRIAILNVRKTKQETADARQEVDTLHLQLQNLKYEQSHLKRQIALCENYGHPYQSLPLIPVEDFLSLFPAHATLDERSLMMARIKHEHEERETAKNKQFALLKRKEELAHENSKKRTELEKLDKQLDDFVKWTKGIKDTFDKASVVC